MEPIETNEPLIPSEPRRITLTPEAQYYLRETAKWANFLSIVGFIMCALFLIAALCIGVIFSFLGRISPVYAQMPAFGGTFLSIIFILFDVLYFFFPFYLYQFAAQLKRGLSISDELYVAKSLGKLKSFFKLAGIVTIVMLCIYALELIAVVTMFSAMPR